MLYREYKDFDDAFYNINRELVYNPDLFNFCTGMDGFVEDLIIKSNSINCSLELNKFAYKIGKWKSLLSRYLDYDKWLKFKEDIPNITGNTYTFYFNQHSKHNGPCLIGLVFMRRVKSEPWYSVKVLYRITELQRRFSADLVLLHKMLKDINDTVDCVNVEQVEFFLPYGYVSTMFINGYLDYFDINIDELDKDNYFIESLLKKHNKYFLPDSPLYEKYQSILRLQKLKQGLVIYPPIDIEGLELSGEYLSDNNKETNIIKEKSLWEETF